VCLNRARTDLCGGRAAMCVPTAKTVDAVRRPHLDGLSAQQPDSTLLLLGGLRADGGAAPLGIKTDRPGAGAVLDDSSEVAEDRSADPDYGAPGLGVDGERLPLRRIVRASLCPVASGPVAVLKKALDPGVGLKEISTGRSAPMSTEPTRQISHLQPSWR